MWQALWKQTQNSLAFDIFKLLSAVACCTISGTYLVHCLIGAVCKTVQWIGG